jgi:nicotinate-nucleotide adenylyltransferase
VKLGLFGGSFDPIHLGHVLPVQEARRRLRLDRVVYLPTASPPHKQDPESAPVAPAAARYAMVEMAILLEEGLFASDHELRSGGPSYTVETLEHFRDEGARAGYELDLHLLLGSDSFAELHTWRRWRELPELARLVVLARPDWEVEAIRGDLAPELRELLGSAGKGGDIEVVTDARVDVSSTEIRRRLARGEPPDEELLPPLVVDYLQKYRFYR